MKNLTKKIIATTALALWLTPTHAFDLSDTLFEKYGNQLNLDPLLIYSVALAESAKANSNRDLGPHPWTLRADKAFYSSSKEEAEKILNKLLKQTKSVDVGLMQVNVRWHGHKVSQPTDLLDPLTNMKIGATFLAEMINNTPNDLELGIGKYHVGPTITANNKSRAKNYGQRVLAIYQNILALSYSN